MSHAPGIRCVYAACTPRIHEPLEVEKWVKSYLALLKPEIYVWNKIKPRHAPATQIGRSDSGGLHHCTEARDYRTGRYFSFKGRALVVRITSPGGQTRVGAELKAGVVHQRAVCTQPTAVGGEPTAVWGYRPLVVDQLLRLSTGKRRRLLTTGGLRPPVGR